MQFNWVSETKRYKLREFHTSDAEALFELNNDPMVLKYTGDKPFESIEAAENFIKAYHHYHDFGFGRWAIIDKETNDFKGWSGLRHSIEKNEVDVGFRIFKTSWNQGIASETAFESLRIGFETFKLNAIYGNVASENLASIKVLQKLGMKNPIPNMLGVFNGFSYVLNNNEWQFMKNL
jgi:[ribosomal protein S5]-alanine N-acetyltransferase